MRGSEFIEVRQFVEVARRRSFARAAEALRVAPSRLSQNVRALEERLGVTLLHRTTRQVSPTSIGARLVERFAPALDEMHAALSEARDGSARPSGVVRLHALRPAYARHVEPLLGLLNKALPDVTLDLSVDDPPHEAAASGYDLVIRRGEFAGGVAAGHLGGRLRHTVVAAPDYLAGQGVPTSPESLAQHRCILWRPGGGDKQEWRFEVVGAPLTVAVAGPLIVSHCDAAVAAALEGVGIAYVLESYAAPFIADGRLVSLLTEMLPSFDGWTLFRPARARPTAAARAVAEFLSGGVAHR